MSTALLIRERNPDDDFVLHGGPPIYTERRSFYPTNSDITTMTSKLSQHDYRSNLYKDVLLHDDHNLRHSLRSMAHSLRLVSDDISKNLEEGSTAKSNYLQSRQGTLKFRDEVDMDDAAERQATASSNSRRWLADSEWNTSSGHHVAFEDDVRRTTLLNRAPSMTLREELLERPLDNEWEADTLRRTVNTDMNMAQVPLTRFTRKDLVASEYFPVTMSCSYSGSEQGSGRSSPRRSRSRTRDRLSQNARQRALSPGRGASPVTPVTDNFSNMRRLEKLYMITSEAPSIDSASLEEDCSEQECRVVQTLRATVELLLQVVVFSPTASAPRAIVSPYTQEIGQLRLQRLRLEEDHLKELNRLTTLERRRGPKPKWYELKDSQFHFEAGKNNDLLRTQDRWMKSSSYELSQSQPDLSTLRMRSASLS